MVEVDQKEMVQEECEEEFRPDVLVGLLFCKIARLHRKLVRTTLKEELARENNENRDRAIRIAALKGIHRLMREVDLTATEEYIKKVGFNDNLMQLLSQNYAINDYEYSLIITHIVVGLLKKQFSKPDWDIVSYKRIFSDEITFPFECQIRVNNSTNFDVIVLNLLTVDTNHLADRLDIKMKSDPKKILLFIKEAIKRRNFSFHPEDEFYMYTQGLACDFSKLIEGKKYNPNIESKTMR